MLTKWGYMGGQKPLQGCYKNHVHKQRSRTNYPVPWHELPCAMARSTMCHGTNYFVPFLRKKKMAQFQNTTNLRYKPTCAMARSTMCHGTEYNVPWHEVVGLFVPLAVHVGVQRLACARSHTVCQCYGLWLHLEGGWVQM